MLESGPAPRLIGRVASVLLGREVTTTPIEEAAMAASRKECGVEVELMASTAGSESTSRLCGPNTFYSFLVLTLGVYLLLPLTLHP